MATQVNVQRYTQILCAIGETMKGVYPSGVKYALVWHYKEGPKVMPAREVKDEIVLIHELSRKDLQEGFNDQVWRFIRKRIRFLLVEGAIK